MLLITLSSASPAHALPSNGPRSFVVTEQIQPIYDIYGGNVNSISVELNGTLSMLNTPPTFSIYTQFKPTIESIANLTFSGPSLTGFVYTTTFAVFPNSTSFQISLKGSVSGASFLWRYLGGVPLVSSQGIGPFPQVYVTVPSGTILSQLYTGNGGPIPIDYVTGQATGPGHVTYNVPSNAALLIFQSSSFLPASIAITVAALAIVALAALNLFQQGRQLFDNISRGLRTGLGGLVRAIPFLGARKGFRFRALLQPKKLLALFILCALVMVAFGAVGGPDPRMKAYVIAGDQATTTQIQNELQSISGNVLVLTPSEDYTDFSVMSSVGQFNVVIFSNVSPTQIQQVNGFVLGNLGNVPIIVVDNTVPTSNITESVETVYPDQTLHVQNAATMSPAELNQLKLQLSLNQRSNILGLSLSNGEFKVLLAVEAVLSMVIVLLGWAYLGSLASESRSMSDLSHLVTLIGGGLFVFFFSEAIYVVTSITLAVPLSLHAVNSGSHDVTAIGLLGFGGGSTPRLAAGFLGVLIGAVGAEGGLRVRKADFALVAGIALILLANPLFIGQYVYQGILLFFPIGNYAFGAAFSSSLSLKGFIYGFGTALGGNTNTVYVLSAGKILFFAGLIPLAYLKRMGRTTTVVALLIVALMIGDGGVRVGEMTPDKTVIAIVPGLVVGFAFVAAILALGYIEKYVRGNWKSRA